jgi:transcriptional regulator with XRE-family HTH domain
MLTRSGWFSQPLSVDAFAHNRTVMPEDFTPKVVLAQNLRALMNSRLGPTTQMALAKKSGVSQATIGRIDRQEVAASVDTVAALANAYSLEPWQLLVPGMVPNNPPVLVPVSAREKALYDRLRAAALEIAELPSPPYKTKPE